MQEVLFDACGEVERQGKVVVVGEGPEHSSPTTYGVLGALVRLNLGRESALPNGAIYMSWVARAESLRIADLCVVGAVGAMGVLRPNSRNYFLG